MRSGVAVTNWKKVKVLIIDEVSMLSKKLFEVLEEIARIARRSVLPFGGIQVIFTGDFFQLPPVPTIGDEDTELFCFESPLWNRVFNVNNHIELETIFRQKDSTYIQLLQEVRKGNISLENKKILQKYVNREYKIEENSGIIPTKIFPIKSKVNKVNSTMFEQIEEQEYVFNSNIELNLSSYLDTGKPFPHGIKEYCMNVSNDEKIRQVEYITNNMNCEKKLVLKKNAVVMCTFNIDVENGICNGSQGIVIDMVKISNEKYSPLVKFHNGRVMRLDPHYWQSDDCPCVAVGQIPLCLSWALTIHKIQGATLPMAEIDIGTSIFEYGQIYVALSRIQSLDGLYIYKFHPDKIKANPKVIEFYNIIQNNTIQIRSLINKNKNLPIISDKNVKEINMEEESYENTNCEEINNDIKKIKMNSIIDNTYKIKIKVKKAN